MIELPLLNFRLKDNEERLEQLEEEKVAISQHAHDLESTIQDLVSQKELTERELKVLNLVTSDLGKKWVVLAPLTGFVLFGGQSDTFWAQMWSTGVHLVI